jgi:hypothetical protein
VASNLIASDDVLRLQQQRNSKQSVDTVHAFFRSKIADEQRHT